MARPDRTPWQAATRFDDGGGIAAVAGDRSEPDGDLERLVYVSRAAPGLDTTEVYAIIRHAHAGNAVSGVTGALVFLDGWFVQLLEGPAAALDARLASIRRDPAGINPELTDRGQMREGRQASAR